MFTANLIHARLLSKRGRQCIGQMDLAETHISIMTTGALTPLVESQHEHRSIAVQAKVLCHFFLEQLTGLGIAHLKQKMLITGKMELEETPI